MTTYTTTDGRQLDDRFVACLIGASLPTPAACAEAIETLRDALRDGISHADLWQLSSDLVWGRREGPAVAITTSRWSDEIAWEDGERPASTAPAPATADTAFEDALAQMTLF